VVVNLSGTPVTMLWAADVPAIVQVWYSGNEAGNEIADVLFGDFDPVEKLAVSWSRELRDDSTYLNTGSSNGRCLYCEDIFLGYRYHEKAGRAPQWAFGHGLSYSTFELPSLKIESTTSAQDGEGLKEFPRTHAALKIRHTSAVAESAVLQLYVTLSAACLVPRPSTEVQGFERVYLEPGEEKEVKDRDQSLRDKLLRRIRRWLVYRSRPVQGDCVNLVEW
jgi:beta-glucosidase